MTRPVVGRRLVRLGTVGSTMDEAAALAAAGAPEGTVVVAREQTAGRGRAGRAWRAPAGTALLCSVVLRPPLPPARLATLPLVVGVAVAEAIEGVVGLRCRLKWPNDVWLGAGDPGRKAAGVLLAARAGPGHAQQAIVGIGVNVSAAAGDLPPGATSLAAEAGRAVAPEAVLAALLPRLDAGYRAFLAAEGRPSLDDWRARAALLGEAVAVEDGGRRRVGVLRGVDDDGALLLAGADGSVARVVAGELVRGPVREPDAGDGRRERRAG